MPDVNWVPIVITAAVSLLGGGAMGALINNHFAKARSRVQPVRYQIGTDILSGLVGPNDEYDLRISLRHGEENYGYSNLAIVRLRIANVGANDIAEFPFGLSLSNGDNAIFCNVKGPDRHNPIDIVEPPTPLAPKSSVDFNCKPFNRGREYSITLYVSPRNGAEKCGDIIPSSPVSVNFVLAKSFVILSQDELDYVIDILYGSIPIVGGPLVRFLRSRRKFSRQSNAPSR